MKSSLIMTDVILTLFKRTRGMKIQSCFIYAKQQELLLMNAKYSYELYVMGIVSETLLPSALLNKHNTTDYTIHYHLR